MKPLQKLRCANHGKMPWKLTICCAGCGRVYQAVLEDAKFVPLCDGAVRAPEICVCGLRLPGKDGSARAICTICFKDRTAAAAQGAIQ